MAVGFIGETPGMTREQYDRMRAEVMRSGPPQGMLCHIAGPTERGWQVITVWESEEAAARFVEEKLKPAAQAAGISLPQQPQRFEVYNFIAP